MNHKPSIPETKGFILKDSGRPLSRHPSCTDYIETHDKNWDRETREYWQIKSNESMKHIHDEYCRRAVCEPPQATKPIKWYSVPSITKESR